MSKENKLLITFTRFMLEHGIECEEDIYQNDKVDEDSLELIEDLFNIVKLTNYTCNCQHNNNPRDNEPCCRCDSRTAKINKARVNSLEIIARMLDDKPYYELKYRQVGKKDYSIGYSSYDLKTVLGYIDTYFEIVESDKQTNADRIRNMSDEELAESGLCPHMVNWRKGNYDTCVHPNDKDACKKCMLDWLQSEAE